MGTGHTNGNQLSLPVNSENDYADLRTLILANHVQLKAPNYPNLKFIHLLFINWHQYLNNSIVLGYYGCDKIT